MADGNQIKTPEKLRNLQRTLYRQAKGKPKWKAWSLYGDLCRSDVLEEAMKRVAGNRGSSGVDGYSVDRMQGEWETFRDNLQKELREKTHRPEPVLRVWIDKPDGGKRPLGIPTVKDRVVQTALVILLEPIFEADFHPESHAYRPGRQQQDAIDSIVKGIRGGLDHAVNSVGEVRLRMVRYADDFVILTKRCHLAEVRRRTRAWLERAGLQLNEEKTGEVDLNGEEMKFLGFSIRRRKSWRSGKLLRPCGAPPQEPNAYA